MFPIHFSPDCTPEAMKQALEKLSATPGTGGVLLLCASEEPPDTAGITACLHSSPAPVFGGFFPELLHLGARHRNGILAVSLPGPLEMLFFPDLSVGRPRLEQTLADWQRHSAKRMLLVFLDGFSPYVADLRDALYNRFGLRTRIIGAGTGCLTAPDRPTVLTSKMPAGLCGQAAVCAMVDLDVSIGLAHGWIPCSNALRVTKSHEHRIVSLNWQPAAQVYCQVLSVDPATFAASAPRILQAHPFGIARISDDLVVRDPLSIGDDGSILCIGDIPQGSFVYILSATAHNLVIGAKQAYEQASSSFTEAHPGKQPDVTLLFDCISRALYLGSQYADELAAVEDNGRAIGALSVGEMASFGLSFLEFYNKTTLITMISAEDG